MFETDKQNPPIASIAIEEERAWERFRLAVVAKLENPSPANLAALAAAKRAFIHACGE